MMEAEDDDGAAFALADAMRPSTPTPPGPQTSSSGGFVALETKADSRTRTASTLRSVGASIPTSRPSESEVHSMVEEGGIITDDLAATESLDGEAFARWVTCLCVVAFDIELGQAMEYMYPPGRLSDAEKTAIGYLSFPDSNAGILGDSFFSFRIKAGEEHHPPPRLSVGGSTPSSPVNNGAGANANGANTSSPGGLAGAPNARGNSIDATQRASSASAPTSPLPLSTPASRAQIPSTPADDEVYYGYVFFRQVRDANLKRGYFQKSVVLLSPHPYIGLFSSVVRRIAPEFFENGRPLLEAACHNISRWPRPDPGHTYELPILGNVLQVRIPGPSEKADFWNDASDERDGAVVGGQRRIMASLHEVDAYTCFRGVLVDVYGLWELVLTAQPIVVMAAMPTTCSETVLALISLISPLHYACDYRPYFTIHDGDFKEFASKQKLPPNVILGVTNPYFSKAFQHWPHMLRVGPPPKSGSSGSDATPGLVRRRRSDWKTALTSEYRPYLERDKVFLKRLVSMPNKNPDGTPAATGVASPQNICLRRHFAELTNAFMAPLERYFASLMPLQKKVMAWRNPPRLKPFNKDEFLKAVETHGPHVSGGRKGDWVGLYRSFIASANFLAWYRTRQAEANDRLRKLYLDLLCQADVATWMRNKPEVEVVDLLLRLREELTNPKSRRLMTSAMADQLGAHIDTIVSNLPDDLRTSLQVATSAS